MVCAVLIGRHVSDTVAKNSIGVLNSLNLITLNLHQCSRCRNSVLILLTKDLNQLSQIPLCHIIVLVRVQCELKVTQHKM